MRLGLDSAVEAALMLLVEKDQVGCRRFVCVRWAPRQKTCRCEVPRALTLDQVPPTDAGLPDMDQANASSTLQLLSLSDLPTWPVPFLFFSRHPPRAGSYLQD
ncbi:hypothetical protein HPB52_021330 [Rhipicephalus sanguineus]|uniref:Uncharacterized protein n=1 Tax=Rhipicephalus sanguineus TaxID=34632 RepID=A0A9D4SPN6_RHISA|nr:hypothetical protein HPB52_021330 [Rhipicephalus sanguineus]